MKEKRTKIPDRDEYRQTLINLTEQKNIDTIIALRLGCELGMTRIEIANARISDLDRFHKRGLWIEVAKRVRRGNKTMDDGTKKPLFEMRQREVPVNANLYTLLQSYINKNQVYILKREKGNVNKPFAPRYINTLYEQANISWSNHKSRHFFKNRVKDWMREARQVDEELISEFMGHKKTQTQQYGSTSWDYKRDVIDKVFQ